MVTVAPATASEAVTHPPAASAAPSPASSAPERARVTFAAAMFKGGNLDECLDLVIEPPAGTSAEKIARGREETKKFFGTAGIGAIAQPLSPWRINFLWQHVATGAVALGLIVMMVERGSSK